MPFQICTAFVAGEDRHRETKQASNLLCPSQIYSRNSENNTAKYPDLLDVVPGLLKPGVKSLVLDCEAVAYDRVTNKILPFQVPSYLVASVAAAVLHGACVVDVDSAVNDPLNTTSIEQL